MIDENAVENGSKQIVRKETQDIIDASMDHQFQENMRKYTLVGELSNWRTNMKDNKRRQQILSGRAKILDLVNKACSS